MEGRRRRPSTPRHAGLVPAGSIARQPLIERHEHRHLGSRRVDSASTAAAEPYDGLIPPLTFISPLQRSRSTAEHNSCDSVNVTIRMGITFHNSNT